MRPSSPDGLIETAPILGPELSSLRYICIVRARITTQLALPRREGDDNDDGIAS